MVARICAASPRYADFRTLAEDAIETADRLCAALREAGERDEAAFGAVVTTQALPRQTDAERRKRAEGLERALTTAAEVPLHAAGRALDVLQLAQRLLEIPNRNLVSDIGCAAEFAAAGAIACGYNVRVNHLFMKDERVISTQAQELAEYEREAAMLLESVRRSVAGTLSG